MVTCRSAVGFGIEHAAADSSPIDLCFATGRGYGAPYATDTSPRHGRRASNLGGGALHAEYQQQYGGQYGGVYGAPQLLSKGAVDYGAAQYGRNESFGRVTTHWSKRPLAGIPS